MKTMFKLYKNADGAVAPFEQLPVAAITPKLGMALVMNADGQLAIATGTTAPTYICMEERSTACTAGELINVIRVEKGQIFETSFSAAATSIKLGNKVTLHASNGLQVTATTSSGVAEVVGMDGTASGSTCLVRF